MQGIRGRRKRTQKAETSLDGLVVYLLHSVQSEVVHFINDAGNFSVTKWHMKWKLMCSLPFPWAIGHPDSVISSVISDTATKSLFVSFVTIDIIICAYASNNFYQNFEEAKKTAGVRHTVSMSSFRNAILRQIAISMNVFIVSTSFCMQNGKRSTANHGTIQTRYRTNNKNSKKCSVRQWQKRACSIFSFVII